MKNVEGSADVKNIMIKVTVKIGNLATGNRQRLAKLLERNLTPEMSAPDSDEIPSGSIGAV